MSLFHPPGQLGQSYFRFRRLFHKKKPYATTRKAKVQKLSTFDA